MSRLVKDVVPRRLRLMIRDCRYANYMAKLAHIYNDEDKDAMRIRALRLWAKYHYELQRHQARWAQRQQVELTADLLEQRLTQ